MEFTEVGKPGVTVDKNSGVAVTDGGAADEQYIIWHICGMKVAAGNLDGAVNGFAVAFPVLCHIYFFYDAGVHIHAVLHIAGGDEECDIVVDRFTTPKILCELQLKMNDPGDKI